MPRRGGGGGDERWDASEDFELQLRRARNSQRMVDAGRAPPANVPPPFDPPVVEDEVAAPEAVGGEEATLVADGDLGNASSLDGDDEGARGSGGNAGRPGQPVGTPSGSGKRPAESFSRSGRGKKPPPAKRHRKVWMPSSNFNVLPIDHSTLPPACHFRYYVTTFKESQSALL